MVMNYSDCCEKFGGRYRTDLLIRKGQLRRVAVGLYSDTPEWSNIEVVLARYPNAVVTLQSAYYYYELSDSIPDAFHLATDRDASKIYDERIVQHFLPKGTVGIGVVASKFMNDVVSRIFDKERLLIETARNKTKLPYDLYKEVIESFRRIKETLYPAKLTDYLESFPKKDSILRTIESEVF
ncbi:MAG: hypothetical protein ACI4I0_05925 [Acutalibacteraceae bacterium]